MTLFGLPLGRIRVRRALSILLYVLVALGCAIRLREAFMHNPIDQLWSDPGRHWEHASQPLGTAPLITLDPPVFQMWLSLVQKWCLGTPLLVACYAGLLSIATPWLWYRFLRDSIRVRELALTGWVLFTWLPSWIGIYSYFMTETLFLTLMGASLWQTVRADRKCTVSSFCAMTALWTLTGMTRGIAIPLGGVAGLWVWLRLPRVRTAAASLLIVALMAIPFAIRNHDFLSLWSPLGSGWPNQIYAESGRQGIEFDMVRDGEHWTYGFGSPSYYAKQLEPLSNWEPKRVGVLKVFANLRKGPDDWRTSYQQSAVHGWQLLKLRWENVILVMLGKSWPDDNPDFLMTGAAMGMRWIWAPLFVLVMSVAAVRLRLTRARPLLPALIATWFLFQGVFLLAVNEGRYRKPLEGLLIAQVIVLLDMALQWRRSTFKRTDGHGAKKVGLLERFSRPKSSLAPLIFDSDRHT